MATAKVRGLQTVATRCCCKLPQAAVQVNQKARTNSGATFQNAAAEIRPHARRRQWVQVWKPNPGNCIRDSPSRKQLRELATTQARQLGKACVGDLKKVSKAMPKKAPGPDGWTSEFIKDLDEGGMDTLTQEMREWS